MVAASQDLIPPAESSRRMTPEIFSWRNKHAPTFFRELSNPYEANAVAVYCEGKQIGILRSELARELYEAVEGNLVSGGSMKGVNKRRTKRKKHRRKGSTSGQRLTRLRKQLVTPVDIRPGAP